MDETFASAVFRKLRALEDENEQLRRELERLRRQPRVTSIDFVGNAESLPEISAEDISYSTGPIEASFHLELTPEQRAMFRRYADLMEE